MTVAQCLFPSFYYNCVFIHEQYISLWQIQCQMSVNSSTWHWVAGRVGSNFGQCSCYSDWRSSCLSLVSPGNDHFFRHQFQSTILLSFYAALCYRRCWQLRESACRAISKQKWTTQCTGERKHYFYLMLTDANCCSYFHVTERQKTSEFFF
jgi:hypothetical protein